MGAPHNTQRYGELWPDYRIEYPLRELKLLRDWVILSGGWAWHFMSPEGHNEYKHAHDHKDIDIFVLLGNVASVVTLLKSRGFDRVWTKYDKHESKEDFRRYEKTIEVDESRSLRITIDFFVSADVPIERLKDGMSKLNIYSLCTVIFIPVINVLPFRLH